MKKNQLVVIVSFCILSFSCYKQRTIDNGSGSSNVGYVPETVVQFDFNQRGFVFRGNDIVTFHRLGDSLYRFTCINNQRKFKFEFTCSGFDKDTLLLLKGSNFRFWEDIFEYQPRENIFVIHFQRREGNFYSGYFSGYISYDGALSSKYLNGNFALLYFKND